MEISVITNNLLHKRYGVGVHYDQRIFYHTKFVNILSGLNILLNHHTSSFPFALANQDSPEVFYFAVCLHWLPTTQTRASARANKHTHNINGLQITPTRRIRSFEYVQARFKIDNTLQLFAVIKFLTIRDNYVNLTRNCIKTFPITTSLQ
jgi:hypothetical protein